MFNHFTQVALLAVGMGLLYADIVAAKSIVMLLIFAATSGVQVAQARTSSVPEIPTGEFLCSSKRSSLLPSVAQLPLPSILAPSINILACSGGIRDTIADNLST